MKILNFGSLNIDLVYRVPEIVKPGETLASSDFAMHAGGKGLNQSAALARAGAKVYHGGKVGLDGVWLKERLKECGVNTNFIRTHEGKTGNAVIQVDDAGENAIFLYAGANHAISEDEVNRALDKFSADDVLLLQNETNLVGYMIKAASRRGLKVCFNPAPMSVAVAALPLHLVDTLILNQSEASGLVAAFGQEVAGENMLLRALANRLARTTLILTLGSRGVLAMGNGDSVMVDAPRVKVVDTTAAGDTFTGFYLASRVKDMDIRQALELACKAAAISVTRPGAMDSIPTLDEVQ